MRLILLVYTLNVFIYYVNLSYMFLNSKNVAFFSTKNFTRLRSNILVKYLPNPFHVVEYQKSING